MGKNCAYCGITAPLTKEHVIPRFISGRRTEKWDTFNARNQTFFQADPQIGDVCAACNSGRLSALDAYVATLWDVYFDKIVMPGDVITLRYDFPLLASWLLKVSFNAARASKNERDADVLRRYLPYILSWETAHPPLAIYLQLMTPYLLSPEEEQETDPLHLAELPRNKNGRAMLEPREIRPARGSIFNEVTVRLMALHSYYFYLILATTKEVQEQQWKKRWREVRDELPSAKYLAEDKTELRIPASRANFLESKMPHMRANAAAYEHRRDEYLKSLRTRKK